MSDIFERMTGLALLHPAFLALALLVPAAAWAARGRALPSVLFGPGTLLESSEGGGPPRTWRTRTTSLPTILHVVALVLLVVAIARPVRRDRLPVETEGIDIVMCLDVSSSMTTDDMDARRTRLDVARDAAARFIAGRPSDRIGLVAFARFPDLRCPPTLDHEALAAILADVAPVASDDAEDSTGIGTAVASAARVLRSGAAKGKVVILLTDGEENVAVAGKPDEIAPVHAAQMCKDAGVRVYAIAAGGDAGVSAGGRADTRPIERMAERTGGRFFAARDAAAVDEVYASIDALEKVAQEAPRYRMEERFAPFVVAALVLLCAGILLRFTALDVLP